MLHVDHVFTDNGIKPSDGIDTSISLAFLYASSLFVINYFTMECSQDASSLQNEIGFKAAVEEAKKGAEEGGYVSTP